jgi:hypothetical protein
MGDQPRWTEPLRIGNDIMLRRVSELSGYTFQAIDGRVGNVSDLLFDDRTWKVRWVVADTGAWLTGRKVLLNPFAIGKADDVLKLLPVDLTKERIEASPDIQEHQPVSQQMQTNLYGYYGWDSPWEGGQYGAGDAMGYSGVSPAFFSESISGSNIGCEVHDGDPHLRSTAAVTGYHIRATDGEIGHVASFLVDDQGWDIRYLVIDTRNWWQGDHVLVAPATVAEIDWSSGKVLLRVTREEVRASRAWQAEEALPEGDQTSPPSDSKSPE